MSDKEQREKTRQKLMRTYDLEKRVTNIIPVGTPADPTGAVTGNTFNDLPFAIFSDTITSTAVGAVKLSVASIPCRRLTILADAGNAGNVLVGGIEAQFPLVAGAGITIVIDDVNKVYRNMAVGDIVHYIAERY